jgi:hypothetical protein
VGVAALLIAIVGGAFGWRYFQGSPEQSKPIGENVESKGPDALPTPPTPSPASTASTTASTLVILEGTPQTEVWVDGKQLGSTGSDGTFRGEVPEGSHQVSLQKADFATVELPGQFLAGESLAFSGDQVRLKRLGWLQVNVTPPQSQVTYLRNGETRSATARNGDRVSLAEGQYTVTVASDKYVSRSESVTISADKPFPLNWALSPKKADFRFGMEGLEGSFVSEDGWQVHKGKFALAKTSAAGAFYFDAKLKKINWIAGYENDKNYVQFQIDEKNIAPTVVTDGKSVEGKPIAHQMAKRDGYYTITIQVTTDGVFFYSLKGAEQVNFFNWTSPDSRLLERKFGFRDEANLKNFRFEGSR